MIEFSKIEDKDIEFFRPYLEYHDYKFCDYTAATIVMWKDFFSTEYAVVQDSLAFKFTDVQGRMTFAFPLSKDLESYNKRFEAVEELCQYAREKGSSPHFGNVPEMEIEMFANKYEKAEITKDRNWADYLYAYEDLAELKGRKFSSKRNLIHNFDKLYEGYKVNEITNENVEKVIDFYDEYYKKNEKKYGDGTVVENEARMVKEALEKREIYNMTGAFIEVGDDVVAFSLGEIVKDVVFVHIEKADIQYKGAYQKINQEFLKLCKNVKYVNREEDLGDLGLRKAKLSYQPIELLDKYIVNIC